MKNKTVGSASVRRRLTPGRPTIYQFEGLFLPAIPWELKTEGIAWYEMENEPNELGTLFRNLRRHDVDLTSSLHSVLPRILKQMPPRTAEQFVAAAQAAKKGVLTAELLEQMPGNWACFRMGAANGKSPYVDEYVLIESESKAAETAMQEGNYRRAAELVQNNSSLRRHWSDDALQGLADARTPNETLRPRLQAWLQLQVDVLAKWSMREQKALQAQHNCGNLEYLLAELHNEDAVAPGAQWLRAMVRLTEAKSLARMLKQVRNETDPRHLPSEATIKRWSRGSMFPVLSPKLEKFVERVSHRAAIAKPSVDRSALFESSMWYHWAARRFDSILWFAALLHTGSPTSVSNKHVHTPSGWLRAEFKRLQSYYAPAI